MKLAPGDPKRETCSDCGRPICDGSASPSEASCAHATDACSTYDDDPLCAGLTIARLRARNTELEQRLARVAELAHDRNDDTHEWRSRRLGQCAGIPWDHMEESFSKDPLKRKSTLKWAHLAKQLAESEHAIGENLAELASVHAAIGDRASHGPKGDAACAREWIRDARDTLEEYREELASIRELCAGAGCSDPGEECADRTLAMAEELRQRTVCGANHHPLAYLETIGYTLGVDVSGNGSDFTVTSSLSEDAAEPGVKG